MCFNVSASALFLLHCDGAELIENKYPFLKLVMQGQRGGGCLLWPRSEQSQVPLAHITSSYSCHQAQASGAERVRDSGQRQGEKGSGTTDKKAESKQREH